MKNYRVLVINPGSTSTKVGVFEGENKIYEDVARHSTEELAQCGSIVEQESMRLKLIHDKLAEANIDLSTMDAFVGRCGIVKPTKSGTYAVNDKLVEDLKTLPSAHRHASALGGLFARSLGEEFGKPSFVADPVTVDERNDIAKVTGLPDVERSGVFHCLNQKASARRYCAEVGKKYNEVNVIVCHMGGGITVGAHEKGIVVDVNDGIAGEGPFSPERIGYLPVKTVLDLCYSGKYTKEELYNFVSKSGGFVAHLGTNSHLEVENKMLEGDETCKRLFEAQAYTVAKYIGEMATVLRGEVEAIILTGGLAYSKPFCELIEERVKFIAPVKRYPGEKELEALAAAAIRVLSGEEEAKEYMG